jgi:dihydrolipoamide dehydrogenase
MNIDINEIINFTLSVCWFIDGKSWIIIIDENNHQILGSSIIGVHATDLIHELTLAIKNNLKIEDVIETIHAHPTTSEVIHEAALDTIGGALHYVRIN